MNERAFYVHAVPWCAVWLAAAISLLGAPSVLGVPIATAAPSPSEPTAVVPETPRVRAFDGGHFGVLFGAGASLAGGAHSGLASPGLDLRIGLRAATLLTIVDLEVAWDAALRATSSRHEMGLQIAAHPGFLYLLDPSVLARLAAGVHLIAGLGVARFATTDASAVAAVRQSGSRLVHWAPSPSLGAGIDWPMTSLLRPTGWWLTARWTVAWHGVGTWPAPVDIGDQRLQLLVGWRRHRQPFVDPSR